jgi:hypothetical protein
LVSWWSSLLSSTVSESSQAEQKMKKIIIALAILMLLNNTAFAYGYFDGDQLTKQYKSYKLAMSNSDSASSFDRTVAVAYMGYVAAVADTYFGISECFRDWLAKNHVKQMDLADIAGHFLLENKYDRTDTGSEIVLRAYMEKSRCVKY